MRALRIEATNGDGRAMALRRLRFVLDRDGSVAVVDDDHVVDRYPNLSRALISYGLRRRQLVPTDG